MERNLAAGGHGEAVAPIDRDVRRGAAYAEQLREQLAALMPVHKVRYGSDMINFVEAVPDEAALRTVLDDEAAKSQTSIMLMDPGTQETGADHERYLEAGSLGVRIRMIFPHGTRYDATAEGDMQTLNHAGVQCRTADELPLRLVAFDDVTCVLGMDDDVPDDESDAVALLVRHPLLKATLVGVFEHAWLRAMPYTHTDPRPGLRLRRPQPVHPASAGDRGEGRRHREAAEHFGPHVPPARPISWRTSASRAGSRPASRPTGTGWCR